MVKSQSAMQNTWVQSLGWEDPLEKGMSTHSSVLDWKNPTDRGAWQATGYSGAKSHTQLKRQHARTVRILHFLPTCYHDPLPSKPLKKKAALTFKMDCFTCISLKLRE